jgi:hypothetical protein
MECIRVALQNKRGLTPSDAISVEPEQSVIVQPMMLWLRNFNATSTKFRISHYSTELQGSRDIHLSSPSLIKSVSDISQLSGIQTQVELVSIHIALSRLWRSWE